MFGASSKDHHQPKKQEKHPPSEKTSSALNRSYDYFDRNRSMLLGDGLRSKQKYRPWQWTLGEDEVFFNVNALGFDEYPLEKSSKREQGLHEQRSFQECPSGSTDGTCKSKYFETSGLPNDQFAGSKENSLNQFNVTSSDIPSTTNAWSILNTDTYNPKSPELRQGNQASVSERHHHRQSIGTRFNPSSPRADYQHHPSPTTPDEGYSTGTNSTTSISSPLSASLASVAFFDAGYSQGRANTGTPGTGDQKTIATNVDHDAQNCVKSDSSDLLDSSHLSGICDRAALPKFAHSPAHTGSRNRSDASHSELFAQVEPPVPPASTMQRGPIQKGPSLHQLGRKAFNAQAFPAIKRRDVPHTLLRDLKGAPQPDTNSSSSSSNNNNRNNSTSSNSNNNNNNSSNNSVHVQSMTSLEDRLRQLTTIEEEDIGLGTPDRQTESDLHQTNIPIHVNHTDPERQIDFGRFSQRFVPEVSTTSAKQTDFDQANTPGHQEPLLEATGFFRAVPVTIGQSSENVHETSTDVGAPLYGNQSKAFRDISRDTGNFGQRVQHHQLDVHQNHSSQVVQPSHNQQDTHPNHYLENIHQKHHTQAYYLNHFTQDVQKNQYSQDVHINHHSQDVHATHHTQDVHINHHSQDVHTTHHSQDAHTTHHSQDAHANHHSQDVHINHQSQDVHSNDHYQEVNSNYCSQDVYSQHYPRDVHPPHESNSSRFTEESRCGVPGVIVNTPGLYSRRTHHPVAGAERPLQEDDPDATSLHSPLTNPRCSSDTNPGLLDYRQYFEKEVDIPPHNIDPSRKEHLFNVNGNRLSDMSKNNHLSNSSKNVTVAKNNLTNQMVHHDQNFDRDSDNLSQITAPSIFDIDHRSVDGIAVVAPLDSNPSAIRGSLLGASNPACQNTDRLDSRYSTSYGIHQNSLQTPNPSKYMYLSSSQGDGKRHQSTSPLYLPDESHEINQSPEYYNVACSMPDLRIPQKVPLGYKSHNASERALLSHTQSTPQAEIPIQDGAFKTHAAEVVQDQQNFRGNPRFVYEDCIRDQRIIPQGLHQGHLSSAYPMTDIKNGTLSKNSHTLTCPSVASCYPRQHSRSLVEKQPRSRLQQQPYLALHENPRLPLQQQTDLPPKQDPHFQLQPNSQLHQDPHSQLQQDPHSQLQQDPHSQLQQDPHSQLQQNLHSPEHQYQNSKLQQDPHLQLQQDPHSQLQQPAHFSLQQHPHSSPCKHRQPDYVQQHNTEQKEDLVKPPQGISELQHRSTVFESQPMSSMEQLHPDHVAMRRPLVGGAGRANRFSWHPEAAASSSSTLGLHGPSTDLQRSSLDLGNLPLLQKQIRASSELCLQASRRHLFASSADIYKLFSSHRHSHRPSSSLACPLSPLTRRIPSDSFSAVLSSNNDCSGLNRGKDPSRHSFYTSNPAATKANHLYTSSPPPVERFQLTHVGKSERGSVFHGREMNNRNHNFQHSSLLHQASTQPFTDPPLDNHIIQFAQASSSHQTTPRLTLAKSSHLDHFYSDPQTEPSVDPIHAGPAQPTRAAHSQEAEDLNPQAFPGLGQGLATGLHALALQRQSSGYSSETELQQIEHNARAVKKHFQHSRKLAKENRQVPEPEPGNPAQEFVALNTSADHDSITTAGTEESVVDEFVPIDVRNRRSYSAEPVYVNQMMMGKGAGGRNQTVTEKQTDDIPPPLPARRQRPASVSLAQQHVGLNKPCQISQAPIFFEAPPCMQENPYLDPMVFDYLSERQKPALYHHHYYNHHHHQEQQQQQQQDEQQRLPQHFQQHSTYQHKNGSLFHSNNSSPTNEIPVFTQNQVINFQRRPVTITSHIPSDPLTPVSHNLDNSPRQRTNIKSSEDGTDNHCNAGCSDANGVNNFRLSETHDAINNSRKQPASSGNAKSLPVLDTGSSTYPHLQNISHRPEVDLEQRPGKLTGDKRSSSSATQQTSSGSQKQKHERPDLVTSDLAPTPECRSDNTRFVSKTAPLSPVELAQVLEVPFSTNIISDEQGDRLSTLV